MFALLLNKKCRNILFCTGRTQFMQLVSSTVDLLICDLHMFNDTFIHSYFYSTTKHEILQLSNYNLPCSLDPTNQGRLFWVVGPKLVNDNEYNWLHKSNYVFGYVRSCLEGRRLSGDLWQGEIREINVEIN